MTFRSRCLGLLACSILTCALSSAQDPQTPPSRYALLIGIDKYEHPASEIKLPPAGVLQTGRFAPELVYTNLAGPSNDVESMRQILTAKFGFPNDSNHVIIMLNEQAKHDAIMKALQQYLVDTPKKGDTVVLYVSSHGSLRIYPRNKGNGQLYNLLDNPGDQRRAENTIVPYDWNDGVDDIFSRDLRHFYREAVDKGIHVTAIFDSCYSGDLGRGLLSDKIVARDFDFDPREMTPNPYEKEERPTLPQDDPVNPVLILSAAQKDQEAIDDGTANPPHGLFTSALLDALSALPPNRPVSDAFSRLQVSMELARHARHQQPEIDTTLDRQQEPIFGGEVDHGPQSVAVEAVNQDGVLLDVGVVADIGPGSIFTTMPGSGGTPVELKVTQSVGLGRSLAQIQTPGGTVQAKDLVQLKAAVPWQRPNLLIYAGATNPILADVQAAVATVSAAHLALAPDPSQDPWTYHLYWDTSHWTLYSHSRPPNGKRPKPEEPINLGASLTVKALARIPPGSIVWFDPPLAREATQGLLSAPTGDVPPVAAQLVTDRSKAIYVIGARLAGDTISYAWFKRSDVDAEVQTPKWMGSGCSPGSGYPLHTEWIDQTSVASIAPALTKYIVKLAKLNGWFLLKSSALGNHQDFPYTLVLRSSNGRQNIGQNGITNPGSYDLYLVGHPATDTKPRWVYVMNVDCQGNGSVVWPYDAPPGKISQPAAKFPIDDKNKLSPEIKLPGYPFPVKAPLGTDTYILLTTSTRLTDYHALAFDGAVSRGATDNPLEELLDNTSGGTRDAGEPIPTDWSVGSMQVQSQPAPNQTVQ